MSYKCQSEYTADSNVSRKNSISPVAGEFWKVCTRGQLQAPAPTEHLQGYSGDGRYSRTPSSKKLVVHLCPDYSVYNAQFLAVYRERDVQLASSRSSKSERVGNRPRDSSTYIKDSVRAVREREAKDRLRV